MPFFVARCAPLYRALPATSQWPGAGPRRAAGRSLTAVLLAVACLTASGCAAGTSATPGGAIRSQGLGRDDRVVVRRHTEVLGVAASRRFVFAATTQGVIAYDRLFARWLPPSSRAGAFEFEGLSDGRPTAMAADPVEDAVWVGMPGAVLIYRPLVDQVQRTMIVGVPDVIAFERGQSGEALVRSGGEWTRISRGGFATPVIGGNVQPSRLQLSGGLDDIYRRYPALRSQLPMMLRSGRDPSRGAQVPIITSGVISPDRPSEVWLGTFGDGLWRVDGNFGEGTPLRFGVLDGAVGAVALAADGVWTAGLGGSQRGGLSFVSDNLEGYRWIEGSIAVPLTAVRTFDLAVRGERAWLGTARGVVRADLGARGDLTSWSMLHGLPSDAALAVAPRADGAWIGTDRGLAFIRDTGAISAVRGPVEIVAELEGRAIRALAAIGDTLWIGTDAGLLAMPLTELARAERARDNPDAPSVGFADVRRVLPAEPELARPIRALAWSDSALLVVTDFAAMELTVRGAPALRAVPDLDVRALGRIQAASIDERAVWVAGAGGVLAVPRVGGLARALQVGSDLPGNVADVLLSREWAWVATTEGLVRVRRAPDGGLP